MRRRTRRTLQTLTRRALLWLVLPLAVLFAVRLIWGWEAARRMTAVEAELRAKGVRFEHPSIEVTEEQNPAAAMAKAAEMVAISQDENKLLDGDGTKSWDETIWTDDQKPLVQALLDRHQEAFHWIDVAGERLGPVSPAGANYDRNLGNFRSLAHLLMVNAVFEHDKGRDRAALRDLQRLHVLAHIIDQRGNIIHNLVAIAIRANLDATIERLSPILHLDAADGSLDSARTLLKALKDPRPLDSVAWNFESEIAYKSALARTEFNLNDWWIRPLRDDDVARAMRQDGAQIEGMRAPDWPTSQKLLTSSAPPGRSDTNLNTLIFWASNNPNAYAKIMTLHFRGISGTRAAAILLACRIHEVQHGKSAVALVDLVPEYLPAAPIDPFSPIGAALRFRVDPEGPTVWSVGENLTDEGGTVRFSATGTKLRRYDNKSPYSQPDIVYGAAWRTARPPAATGPAGPPGSGPWLAPVPSR
jgi:hypothetical protein